MFSKNTQIQIFKCFHSSGSLQLRKMATDCSEYGKHEELTKHRVNIASNAIPPLAYPVNGNLIHVVVGR